MKRDYIVDQPKLRLDRFLAEQNKSISRSRIQKDIESQRVSVNGVIITESKFVVRSGDAVSYDIPDEAESISAKFLDIKVLFENSEVLVIDKPAGLVVHPAPGYKGVTLAEGLLYKYKDIHLVGEDEIRPGIVHRLDKDTSGVMLVAKTQKAFEHLKDAFALRRIKKEYLALLCGRLPSKHGFLNAPIGRHPTDFRKMATVRAKEAKEAITEYEVIGRYETETPKVPGGSVDELTLVRVTLHTGRTHQIRVHFSSLGFPIVGDTLYGRCSLAGVTRQFLHATKIQVQLVDGTWIEVESDLPEDLQKILIQLKKQDANN